jgi:hypothetical protein
MHYLEAELGRRGFTLIWHVGSQLAIGPIHPSVNLAPADVIAHFDGSIPPLADFLRQFDVPILSLLKGAILWFLRARKT